MLRVNFNTKELDKILKNTVLYSEGYFSGIDDSEQDFYSEFAKCILETMNKYIDSQARMHPEMLHHVYEWNNVGDEQSRLFNFNYKINKNSIRFDGKFLPSKSLSSTSTEPFRDKAYIMENAIAIEIEPKNSDVLAFEQDGQTVFTTKTIYIAHPGGTEVENGFGNTVNTFFESYFTYAVLQPILDKLSKNDEYARKFVTGVKVGKSAGVQAGKEYLMSTVRMKIG